jgi:hypothetical protein
MPDAKYWGEVGNIPVQYRGDPELEYHHEDQFSLKLS